jgi:SAM-dependent methyltransferase
MDCGPGADPRMRAGQERPLVGVLARPDVRLLLTSGTLLFVELLLIRWIPANVTYVGFFNNFLLMASFLGIGTGILLGRRFGAAPPLAPFAVLLLLVILLVQTARLNLQLRSSDELFFGLSASRSADVNFLVLPLVVLLTAAITAALALPLGPLLRSMRPLRAYAIDIAGSMLGIALFAGLSAAGTDPRLWFGVVAILVALLLAGTRIGRSAVVAAGAMVAVVGTLVATHGHGDIWSPYYRVSPYESRGLLFINVNGIPHQTVWPEADRRKQAFYEQVYRWFPGRRFERVLIVGAGSGNDTSIALARGAASVDAVEIDPALHRLGAAHHPDRPYADPRVDVHINDGRAFLRNTPERYDLIVFALPDSLTLVSSAANIRLESFLFTEEAFLSVRDHLRDDGIFVLYNYYRERWLVKKITSMLETTFGHPPLVRLHGPAIATIATGPAVTALGDGAPPGDAVDVLPPVGPPQPRPATDDWPFLYLRQGFVAPYYLGALGFLLLAALLIAGSAARATGTSLRRFSPHFFILGVAFLLVETRSIVSFSLLFGTTWIVNALAFFAILASVLLAIAVNGRLPVRDPRPYYVGLFVSLALAFLLPPESLLIDPPFVRYAIAATLAFAPVFFANLVFSYSFRDTRTADMAFASNLLGAMVGGALEYLALLTGYRALLLLVAVLYAIAYLAATRFRVLADRDLSLDPEGSARRSPEASPIEA